MAGLGRKLFTRGTLASSDVQGYLQDQVVMTFASAAARTAAVGAPTAGMVSYLKDVKRYDVCFSDGTWFPMSGRVIARNHVPVSSGIPAGGARESGVADGPLIAGFTAGAPGVALIVARFRVSCPAGGWAYSYVKVNGTAGATHLTRDSFDQDRAVIGWVPYVAGANTLSLRVEANGAQVSWVDAGVALFLGVAE